MKWDLLGAATLLASCSHERVPIGHDREPEAPISSFGGSGGGAAGGSSGGVGGGALGLVAHWPLDETSGLTARDRTSNGNDGTLTGFQAPNWTTGKVGGGLAFTNGPYIVVAPSPSLDAIADDDALTVGAWVSTDEYGTWFQSVLSVQREDGVWETFGLYLKDGIATMVVNTGDGIVGECSGTTAIPLRTWAHVAGTFDGSLVRTFVNGTEECRLSPDALDISRSVNPVLIGSNQNLALPGEFMRGTLDEIVIYARALSGEEIAALAAGLLP